jgi:hypothetical protein
MRDGQNSGGGGGGRTKQVDKCAHEYRKAGTHTHRAPKWTRRPRASRQGPVISNIGRY